MSAHRLKVQPPYFDALLSGDKTFEVRRNDRSYQRGDVLVLVDIEKCDCMAESCPQNPRTLTAEVTYVYSGDPRFGYGSERHGGIEPGYVVLGLKIGMDRA